MKKPLLPVILGMLSLSEIGEKIASSRRQRKLRQADLAALAGVSRATIDALENGRAGEIGFSKLVRLLSALGLELILRSGANGRPTLDELLREDGDD